MVMPYSNLPGMDIIPAANICGVFPGGDCPRYKLSGGMVWEHNVNPNNRIRTVVSADFFIIVLLIA
jgi:hypothetical protein